MSPRALRARAREGNVAAAVLRRHSDCPGNRRALRAAAGLLGKSSAPHFPPDGFLLPPFFPVPPRSPPVPSRPLRHHGRRKRGRSEAFHLHDYPELLRTGVGALGPDTALQQPWNQQLLGWREPDAPQSAALRRRNQLFQHGVYGSLHPSPELPLRPLSHRNVGSLFSLPRRILCWSERLSRPLAELFVLWLQHTVSKLASHLTKGGCMSTYLNRTIIFFSRFPSLKTTVWL